MSDLSSTVDSSPVDSKSLTSNLENDLKTFKSDLEEAVRSEFKGSYSQIVMAALASGITVYGLSMYLDSGNSSQRAILAAGCGGAACYAGQRAGKQIKIVRAGVSGGLYYFGSMRLNGRDSDSQLEALAVAALMFLTSPKPKSN